MMTASDNGSIDYKFEILRKGIHLCSLSIPIAYYYMTKELALSILVPLLVFSLFLEFARHLIKPMGRYFDLLFGFLLREHEKDSSKKTLSGATYVFISAVITILIFPKVIVVLAFSVLIIGDIAAALIGRRFGKHKFLAKSLEGTLAFFVFSSFLVLLTPKVEYLFIEYIIGFAAVAVGAIAENIAYGWADDNLTIPLSVGAVMWILYSLLLPNLPMVLSGVPN